MACHRLAGAKIKTISSWWGVGWVSVSLTLLVIGELSTFRQLSYISTVALIVGMSLVYLGDAATKKIIPAFVFLLFAIPLPFMFYNSLSLNLKLISSTFGVFILHVLGVSVFQDGNIIDLGTYKLQVVDACSGLRYLFPAASFAYLIAYLLKDRFWKKCVIFLSSVPITIGMNALRISVVGITVNIWGPKAAEGFLHLFEGVVVFILCIVILIGETYLLLRIKPLGSFDHDFFTIPRKPLHLSPVLNSRVSLISLILLLVVTALTASGTLAHHATNIPSAPNLSTFPLSLDSWHGKQETLDSSILKELDLTDYWIADYSQSDVLPSVNLYIAYYANQKVGSAAHAPSTCLPGGGWKIERSEDITWTPSENKQTPLHIARLIATSGAQRIVIYYWFDERGRIMTSQLDAKWYLLLDSIIMNRSDGALVRLTTPIAPDESEDTADERLRGFLQTFHAKILSSLP
jgi:exosortase D (VPLPA-CTERM-specific)